MPISPAQDSGLVAWVDESVIVGNESREGAYTLAAVITQASALDDLRHELRLLTERRVVRLHWVSESDKRRDVIAAAVAGLGVMAVVVTGTPVQRQKQERARRCCLERLLYELDQFGVAEVWLESRTGAQDRRDLSLVDSARDKSLMSRRMTVGFARPLQEPMLWLPDVVAGAV